jgi:hypothetical protein
VSGLPTKARLLFWDYERGSLPYDLLVLLMIALVFLIPDTWLLDPLRVSR